MIDREVEHPNRYRLKLVADEDNVFDLIPEPGEIVEEGTPLNKATLLQDSTALNIGFAKSDNPTVDQAFAKLALQVTGVQEYIDKANRTQKTTFQKLITGRFI